MPNRSAFPVVFGFDFQTNAAIVLMLENIKEMSMIRLEGIEDIEITLENGNHIFAQAKSVVKSSSDFKNVLSNLKKSIKSLSEAYHSDPQKVRELIYITNSQNPFKEKNRSNIFYGPSQRLYETLPVTLQNKITKILEEIEFPLDTKLLKIQILPFETDNDKERYKIVYDAIGDFLSQLSVNTINRHYLHNMWSYDIFKSGSRDNNKNIFLKKKEIIWPMIVYITESEDYEEYDIDSSEIEELTSSYKEIINICSEKYEFVTKVLSLYNNFTNYENKKDKLSKFIESEYSNFRYLFNDTSLMLSQDLQNMLIRIILRNIIRKRLQIEKIKKGVNL